MVAPGFDGMDFQTMRWRHYGFELEWVPTKFNKTCGAVRNIPNKVMIDLSRVSEGVMSSVQNSGNPHKPLHICPKNVFANLRETPFVLNHYMGTPRQWFYRTKDQRGIGYRQARYEDMNDRFGVNTSDVIRPWLGHFVDNVGNEEALRLLENVGKLEPLPGNDKIKFNTDADNIYDIGEIIDVNFAGEGRWYPAEIYATYSGNYYSVFYEDCTQEICTYGNRIRTMESTVTSEPVATDPPGDATDDAFDVKEQ